MNLINNIKKGIDNLSIRNEIYIYTDKGSYVGGDTIYGTVFLCIDKPINSKGMIMEIVGYEKVMWQYNHSESYTENGQQRTRNVVREHKDHHDFFKNSFRLIDYPGGFPVGKFSYPFQYTLPATLPGCFYKKRKGGLKMSAKIQYKIKCIVEIPGFFTHDLKVKQHLIIHEKLNNLIQPKHHDKTISVRLCCCIPRGPVRCECWMDKNAYMGGETAQIHVKVQNDSKVDVNHFNTKLIREITLHAGHHRQVYRDIVCQQKYPGTPKFSSKSSDIPLLLMSKRNHAMKPSTSGRLITCTYKMMIELSIPWCPDLEIFSPVSIYAPQSTMWAQWRPPVWLGEAQVQQVCGQLSVPQDVANKLANTALHPTPVVNQVMPSYNPEYSKEEVTSYDGNEKSPLIARA